MTDSLDSVMFRWSRALDADARALDAAAGTLTVAELALRRAALVDERRQVQRALDRLARVLGIRPVPSSPRPPVSGQAAGPRAGRSPSRPRRSPGTSRTRPRSARAAR